MIRSLQAIDELLRPRAVGAPSRAEHRRLRELIALAAAFALLYGAVMGTFGGFTGDRLWQVTFSALKLPLLLLVTFAISLPSFYVFNSLAGLRDDFFDAVRALLAAQAILTIVLAAMAPFTALWYASSANYDAATTFNGLMFLVATSTGQVVLRQDYRPLLARNPRHAWMLRVWLVTYWLVAIQMAWVLRPFVGDPHRPVQFFRDEAWDNAYVIVAKIVWRVLMR